MYSKTATTKSISSYWDNSQIRRSVEKVKRKMESADAILIVMSTIVSRKQVLTRKGCFIPREITVCSSAASPAVRRPLKMRGLSVK